MESKNIAIACFAVLCVVLIIFAFRISTHKDLIGDQEALTEIDKLLVPAYNQTVTEQDFDHLEDLAKDDEYALHEIEEIKLLAKYKEYAHIGHGLGFLYEYIQSGEEPICVGHVVAHYYVFSKHGETSVASHNLEEAYEQLDQWKASSNVNQTYIDMVDNALNKIENGNSEASEEEISDLANAPCA